MDRKALSYDALRSVLSHMDANKKIQIAIACPSLQKVEKSIPLKIDRLDFVSNYEVQINNNLYGFGIIRQYREGTAPEPFRSMNERGGINCDLDEWGFEKPSYRLTETPGDINFGDVLEDNDEGNDDDMEREAQEFRDTHSDDEAVVNGLEYMSYWWMNIGYKLLPYRCRKNNVKPAHDCFVQLNLTSGEFRQPSRPVQKVPYTKKLHEVMKEFMTFIFGGRTCPVQVNCLEIYSTTQIIRLPVGVKFSVHELRVLTKVSSISKFLLPVLDESSFPIKHINQEEPVDLNDPYVANAEEVTFHDGFNLNLFEFLLKLPHLKINFFSKFYDLYNEEDFIKFIKNLLENDEKVGTTYQVGSGEDQRIMETFLKIENGLMKREIIGKKDLLIQKEDGSREVQITYMKDVKQMYFGKIESYCILKIQVLGNRQETN
ncbi:hypothetical protein CAEBREN_23293 [Caenorhabditis brenneri]|uniref:F-box domain-containing protein n=1 Tax=Caenorhabditis brenneri TaxID=135651 RepID=G0PGN9_CAEBE|nr:hypothetical protein CAEBREN_23293 [Caenorhabditis brenneri]